MDLEIPIIQKIIEDGTARLLSGLGRSGRGLEASEWDGESLLHGEHRFCFEAPAVADVQGFRLTLDDAIRRQAANDAGDGLAGRADGAGKDGMGRDGIDDPMVGRSRVWPRKT